MPRTNSYSGEERYLRKFPSHSGVVRPLWGLDGDRVLAKAALYRGYELESEEAVGSYLNAYPEDRRVWDEFTEAAQEHNALEKQDRMFGTLGPEPPRELGGVG